MVPLSVAKVPSAPRAAKEARDAAKFWNLEGHMSSLLLQTSFFLRGRRQGRQPLNVGSKSLSQVPGTRTQ